MFWTFLGLAGVYVLSKGGKKRQAPVAWDVRNAGANAQGQVFFDAFAPAGSFGPHAEMFVIRFSRTGSGPATYAGAHNEDAPDEVIARAIKDLKIKGAELLTRT